jgi:hypothetical protein
MPIAANLRHREAISSKFFRQTEKVTVNPLFRLWPVIQSESDPATSAQKIFGYVTEPMQVMALHSIFEDQQMSSGRFCQIAFTPIGGSFISEL